MVSGLVCDMSIIYHTWASLPVHVLDCLDQETEAKLLMTRRPVPRCVMMRANGRRYCKGR